LKVVHHREKIPPQYQCPFPVYEWELLRYINQSARFNAEIVDCKSIMGPAFITSVFGGRSQSMPICSKPLKADRFWYAHTEFFDRAGWDEVNDTPDNYVENVEDDNDARNAIHIPPRSNRQEEDIEDIDSHSEDEDIDPLGFDTD
jgi:hypothetical protein